METPIFQDVTNERPDRNSFDLSHQVLLTAQMGDLIPTLAQEVIPGDKFRVRSEVFARMMALKHPIMQKIDIYAHYFFVPNRLLWNANNQNDSWQAFITGGRDGSVEPTPPYLSYRSLTSNFASFPGYKKWMIPNSLLDYLGYPVFDSVDEVPDQVGNIVDEKMLAYPILAYNLIYDNYYRDQNLTEPIFNNEEVLTGGDICSQTYRSNLSNPLLSVKKRAWRKDYFTSALPWAQRSLEPVTLPIGLFAPVTATIAPSSLDVFSRVASFPEGYEGQGLIPLYVDTDNLPHPAIREGNINVEGTPSYIKGTNTFGVDIAGTADLSEAGAVTINQLRASIKIQEWLERNATGGARYVEQIYAHFGVVVPDATMQRPIYLGGGKQVFSVSEVTQTSQGTEESPLGSYAGQGYSLGDHIGFDGYQFNEHGWIMCIMSIIPKASYMQGLNRKFSRFNKFDYYFPEFAHLGEQEIKNKELVLNLLDNDHANGTFGYQSRYAEYKYNDDRVSGDFRDTLIDWHLGRKFDVTDGPVELTQDFIEVHPSETNRIFAYTATDVDQKPLMIQIWHDMQAIRPMPVFATPWI